MADPIWLLHIQKCGGSSVAKAVAASLRANGITVPLSRRSHYGMRMAWGAGAPKPLLRELQTQPPADFVFGATHHPYASWMERFQRVVILREPRLRVWSLYTFYRKTKHALSGLARRESFGGFLQGAPHHCSNVIIKLILGREPSDATVLRQADVATAQRRLEGFALVGVLDLLPAFLRALQPLVEARVGSSLPALQVYRDNASTAPKTLDQLDPAILRRVTAMNSYDMDLYESVLARVGSHGTFSG